MTALSALAIMLAGTGCDSDNARQAPGGNNSSDADSDGDSDSDSDGDADDDPNLYGGDRCGDGLLDRKKEACDDGNTTDGDGCKGDCREVQKGYTCYPPGKPCSQLVVCGDGWLLLPELCDDGNTEEGDGCSALCKIEIGWKCSENADGISVCEPTTCGDDKQEGAESCDDGNDVPFDGCNSECQKEPDCSGGACASECGDGLVLGEECDDGNKINGDGCNDKCEVEDGFKCYQEGCASEEDCTLTASVIYRDFSHTHSDFSVSCSTMSKGMVADELGGDWKPRFVGNPDGDCVKSFDDWYNGAPDKVGQIVLYPDGNGNFVNRYGENGEPWMGYETDPNSATGEAVAPPWMAGTVAECEADGCILCVYDQTANPPGCYPPTIAYDGNPLFFPLDDLIDTTTSCTLTGSATETAQDAACAKIPAQYGINGWPWEPRVIDDAHEHNFYFTSEVTYWFKYEPENPATLNFTGDDDVWVFVNGRLAVDLGGVHIPENGSVTIDKNNSFGMTAGNVYKINVFHAERKVEGSSFKLTLGGFNTARSECRPECGDGIVGLGEQCDDGKNDGGYGQCGKNCMWEAYCGDGIVQEEFEHCDVALDPECPNNCFFIEVE